MLRLTNVTKRYPGQTKPAVDDLTLEVREGEIFGFLGPNGAGKTTTIKMIVGLIRPDAGKIRVNGHNLEDDPTKLKAQIGFCPDTPELYERLTGVEYLQLVADIRRIPVRERRERIGKLAETFSLSHALPDLIQSYSHGMRQKLSLIAALLPQPPLLVLDEPMVGLDPKSNHLFKEMMRQHCDNGNTVFFSTHILEVAERLCDRIGIIQHGKLIAVGTMEELRAAGREDASLESIFLELTEGAGEAQ